MIEKDFVSEGLRRTRIDEYLEKELERAGYGGMDVQITPLGTMVIVYAERPGMVIGRGGKNVRAITDVLKSEFGLDNPQIEVKEVDVPELNPKIMAYKISNVPACASRFSPGILWRCTPSSPGPSPRHEPPNCWLPRRGSSWSSCRPRAGRPGWIRAWWAASAAISRYPATGAWRCSSAPTICARAPR